MSRRTSSRASHEHEAPPAGTPSPALPGQKPDGNRGSGLGPAVRARWLAVRRRAVHRYGTPADTPEGPFAAARRSLIATNLLVVAIVLAFLSAGVYWYTAHAVEQGTLAQLRYHATQGAPIAAQNNGAPPGAGPLGPGEGPPRLVPYSPSSADMFMVVLGPSGQITYDSDAVVALGIPVVAAARPVLSGAEANASPVVSADGHSFQLYITSVTRGGQVQWVVIAGTSLDFLGQQLGELVHALIAVYIVVIALTFLTGLFLIERGLEPARLAFYRQRQFASAASHELRTPLAVIRSEAELVTGLVGDSLATLRRAAGIAHAAQANDETHSVGAISPNVVADLEEAQAESRAVTEEIDFMTAMVQDLLLFARDAADGGPANPVFIDVSALVDDIAAKIRPLTTRAGLQLRVDVQSREQPVLWTQGDPALLRQALYKLLENAVRYTPNGGTVGVTVQPDHRSHLLRDRRRYAIIAISDTGIGIAPEHMKSIFEPFYRGISDMQTPRGEQGGTGLGLALAQRIIRAHGGYIDVRSRVGAGTTFFVALPAEPGPTAPTSELPRAD